MRTTVTIDDVLLERAAELAGVEERATLLRLGLETLIRVESARRLAALGGTDPDAGRAAQAGCRRVILVDTSVWIDHLHRTEPHLVALLEGDEVGAHPLVLQELALGSMARREETLGLLAELRRFPTLAHEEMAALVESRRLWGRGLSVVDVHLLGSVLLVPGSRLWTRDRRLLATCEELGVGTVSP